MKRIVNGVVYDTRTATLLASDLPRDRLDYNPHFLRVNLYRTPTGEFFMFEEYEMAPVWH